MGLEFGGIGVFGELELGEEHGDGGTELGEGFQKRLDERFDEAELGGDGVGFGAIAVEGCWQSHALFGVALSEELLIYASGPLVKHAQWPSACADVGGVEGDGQQRQLELRTERRSLGTI